jgi:hypothetical protein
VGGVRAGPGGKAAKPYSRNDESKKGGGIT